MSTRVLPNNLEAEESVLGACFLSKYALQKAAETLTSESFYNEKNGKIFSTMTTLLEEKTPIDITTVTSYLKKKNELTEVGGVEYLTEVLNFVPTASNIDFYIKSVEESALLRNLIITAEDQDSGIKSITVKSNGNGKAVLYGPTGAKIKETALSGTTGITLPAGTTKIEFQANSNELRIYEVEFGGTIETIQGNSILERLSNS